MNDPAAITWFVVNFAGGVALGGVFFGGLWLTARSLTKTAGGPLLVVLSFTGRTALVLFGMYWLTGADWRYVLACLAGFLLARTVIIRNVFRSQPAEFPSQEWSNNEHVAG